MVVRLEPSVHRDGKCRVCGKPRPVPKGVWAREAAKADGFCSRSCAETYFGVDPRMASREGDVA